MSTTIPPYPLHWPDGLPRSRVPAASRFKTTLAQAKKNVEKALWMFATDTGKRIDNIVISSNLLALGGKPADRGVAVWFDWDGAQRVIAVDRYTEVEDNLQAIFHIVEARRTEMRHGGLNIVQQTFRGYTALPGTSTIALQAPKPWREVLKTGSTVPSTADAAKAAYRTLAARFHPDKKETGDAVKWAEIQAAYDAAKLELGFN